MQKNWIYFARYRNGAPRGRSKSRAETVHTPLSFCFTHSRVESKGGRTERGRRRRKNANAGRGEIRRRALDLHLGRHASWNSHSGKKLFYHTSPHRARFSAPLLFCILHWRWDLVVRFRRCTTIPALLSPDARYRPPPSGTERYKLRVSWIARNSVNIYISFDFIFCL